MTNRPKPQKKKQKISLEESATSVQRVIGRIHREPFEEEETRRVKKGLNEEHFNQDRKELSRIRISSPPYANSVNKNLPTKEKVKG